MVPSTSTSVDRHRARGLSRSRRADPAARLRHRRLRAAGRHHLPLRSRLHRQQRAAAGRAHPAGAGYATPSRPTRPSVAIREAERNYDYTRGAFTAPHAARRQPDARVVDAAQLPGSRPSAAASRSSTTRPTAGPASCAGRWPRRWPVTAIVLTGGAAVLRARARTTPSSSKSQRRPRSADRGPDQQRQQLRDLRRGAVRRHPDFTVVAGAARPVRGATACATSSAPTSTDSVDFRSLSPKLGFLWEVAPGGAGLRERLPGLRAAADPRADGARPDPGQPRPAERAAGLAVRDRHPRHLGRPRDVGRRRLRHRAVGRDPERQRPALSRGAVHDPPLPATSTLASHRCRGRPRRAPRARTWLQRARPGHDRRRPAHPRRPTPGRASSSWTTRSSATTRSPGAPEHFLRAELRYDHTSGFWFAPGRRGGAARLLRQQREQRPHPGLYALQRPRRLRLQALEARRLLRGAQPDQRTYTSSVVVDDANKRFFEPGDGRAFYGGLEWRWR